MKYHLLNFTVYRSSLFYYCDEMFITFYPNRYLDINLSGTGNVSCLSCGYGHTCKISAVPLLFGKNHGKLIKEKIKNLDDFWLESFFPNFFKKCSAYRAIISLREPPLASDTEFFPQKNILYLFLSCRHDLYSQMDCSVLDCIIIGDQYGIFIPCIFKSLCQQANIGF